MTTKEQIKFWQKARKMIVKDYIGKEPCKELNINCPKCKARIFVAYIDWHLDLLEWRLENEN